MTPPPFTHSYAELPAHFFAELAPDPVPQPELLQFNENLASELGLDLEWLRSAEGVNMLSGAKLPKTARPIAQAYAGHQFGGWVPQLGDGRALLIGELIDQAGDRRDVQLKGSGPTPFSRRGDGKATLGSTIREYVVSEAMHALGIPTTRALAVVRSGETIPREQLHPGGVFTRVASSQLRVGTFQYFLGSGDTEDLRMLADYAIDRHYPEAREAASPYLALLETVAQRQAKLIASWMQVGFIHGVMNTDNCAISGETIDFGPCAFMEEFGVETVFSSIDRGGRYSWVNQPNIGHWNLACLAETLAPLLPKEGAGSADELPPIFERYVETFQSEHVRGFAAKLGIATTGESEAEFVAATIGFLDQEKPDFTLFFRHLTRYAAGSCQLADLAEETGIEEAQLSPWLEGWASITDLANEERAALMARHNPILIPRNHRVEQAIVAAENGDDAPFHRLVEALASPFAENPDYADLEEPPLPTEVVRATFCGT